MDLIPAIDLLDGEAVRLVQGDYARHAAHVADPETVVRGWMAAGVRCLHIVDLDGARAGCPVNLSLAGQIVRAARAGAGDAPLRAELGGGLRSIGDIAAALDQGIDVAIVGTAAMEDTAFLAAAVDAWPGRIAVSLDVRGDALALDGWTREVTGEVSKLAGALASAGIAQLIVTDTDRDGTRGGPNLALMREIRRAVGSTRLVAAGGIATTDALRALADVGVDGAVVGLALVDGTLSIDAALGAVSVTA